MILLNLMVSNILTLRKIYLAKLFTKKILFPQIHLIEQICSDWLKIICQKHKNRKIECNKFKEEIRNWEIKWLNYEIKYILIFYKLKYWLKLKDTPLIMIYHLTKIWYDLIVDSSFYCICRKSDTTCSLSLSAGYLPSILVFVRIRSVCIYLRI